MRESHKHGPNGRRGTCISETDLAARTRTHTEGPAKRAIETGRNRVIVAGFLFLLGFVAVAGRLVDVTLLQQGDEPRLSESLDRAHLASVPAYERADIVDRNGVVLATSLTTASLYADPQQVLDANAAAAKLVTVLPGLDPKDIVARLRSDGHFVWLYRNLTPRQEVAVNALGIPGLYFQRGERRVYPQGRLASHVLGYTSIDNQGLAGVERYFDDRLRRRDGGDQAPLQLSLDIRAQHVMRQELSEVIDSEKAKGGSGLILDLHSGEILAMVSLPDFDPNRPGASPAKDRFDRNTQGVYEMGSTFKVFTVAMALEYGTASLDETYDTRAPIRIAHYTINDYHRSDHDLSVSDIFIHSSNIGAARMAVQVGGAGQREFLRRLGLFRRPQIELSEIGAPIVPASWREITTMTVAFGHGMAVSPLALATAVGAVADGGILRRPTLVKQPAGAEIPGKRVISPEVSHEMRTLMHRVVTEGTGSHAITPGYRIGGKTGTAEKPGPNGYQHHRLLSSFVGVFPIKAPRYLVLVTVDEPHGVNGNPHHATGGWVAAPAVAAVIERVGPIFGVPPRPVEEAPGKDPVLTADAGVRKIAAQ